MKKLLVITLIIFSSRLHAQIGVKYDPSAQTTKNMQYFKPIGKLSVGDCMPFYHGGVFSLYWLLDSLHGENLHGLGGHQWVLSKTSDLKIWKQEPIVLGIDEGWEKSICTGSVVFYKGDYYAFYATRLINNGQVNEQLSYAISKDGIHFNKQKPNPFYTSAPGYSKRDFRDPKVFVDNEGVFHLFVASDQAAPILNRYAGCLVHLTSKDLKIWTVEKPILTGQGSTPECPDYFCWKGWYYLVYSDNSNTYYVKSRNPYGPWEEPRFQALNEDWANVVKTAAFKNDRRISAAWIPERFDDKDNGHEIFGGNAIFRELIQEHDGTLDTRFPEEMIPKSGISTAEKATMDISAAPLNGTGLTINAPGGVGIAHFTKVPLSCRITMEIEPIGRNEEYGFYLKSHEKAEGGYQLKISEQNSTVNLGNTKIEGVKDLNKPINIDIIMKDGIIDVDVDHRRTIVNRTYEQTGDFLWFYVKHGKVNFSNIKIRTLTEN
jgi:hypothetical protein